MPNWKSAAQYARAETAYLKRRLARLEAEAVSVREVLQRRMIEEQQRIQWQRHSARSCSHQRPCAECRAAAAAGGEPEVVSEEAIA